MTTTEVIAIISLFFVILGMCGTAMWRASIALASIDKRLAVLENTVYYSLGMKYKKGESS